LLGKHNLPEHVGLADSVAREQTAMKVLVLVKRTQQSDQGI
jgi:hypothetical protein